VTDDAPQPSPAPAPGIPPRCWSIRQDSAKVYFHRCGSATPPFRKKLRAWLWDHELGITAVYRYGQRCQALLERSRWLGALPFALFVLLHFVVRTVFHVDINPRCRIGPGLHLGHPYTIFIGPTILGSNCSLTHNVTIGLGLGAKGRGVPIIGNDVWIGPGATLTGPIHIGDGAVIAAGTGVSRDIPARALVVGNPGRVVDANYDSGPIIGYQLKQRDPS
jgi:serine O-acetyltransferase